MDLKTYLMECWCRDFEYEQVASESHAKEYGYIGKLPTKEEYYNFCIDAEGEMLIFFDMKGTE